MNSNSNSLVTYGTTLPPLQSSVSGAFGNITPTRNQNQIQIINSLTNNNNIQLSELFQNQANIVKNLHMNIFNGKKEHSKIFSDLSSVIKIKITPGTGPDSDNLTRSDLIGYKNLLELLAEMTGEKTENNFALPNKFFSNICFSPPDISLEAVAEKKRFLTFHAIKHLQDQICVDWFTAVDQAVGSGQLNLPPSNLGESKMQKLRAYVGYLWYTGEITPTRNLALSPCDQNGKETPVFAYIYHCLRIGEFTGAIREIENCLKAGIRNIEKEILICLQGFQNVLKNMTSTYNIIQPLSQSESDNFVKSMLVCGVLYENEKKKTDLDLDPYRESVLNLLSLKDQNGFSETSLPGSTLEDFLWGNLWFIKYQNLINKSTLLNNVIGKQKIINNGELILYEKIIEFGGSNYFDLNYINPFNYCTILLCCHRFGDAITYLWSAGKFLPAIHLTVSCLHYGLILPHIPFTQNPKYRGTMDLQNSNNFNNYNNYNLDQNNYSHQIRLFFHIILIHHYLLFFVYQ